MAYADVILAEASLQSYWRLGETAGSSTVADSKGSETGTVTAADVTLGLPSLLGGDPSPDTCAQVTGATTSGTLNFGDIYPFTGTASFSVEAWIKPNATALTNNGYIVYNTTAADGWAFRILAAGGIRFFRVGTSVTDTCESAAGVIVANAVYHVVATYNGATMLIYVNSAQVATLPSTRTIADPTITLTVGEATGGGNVAIGYFDEVAIYNDDLSAASVLAHYSAGFGRQNTFEGGTDGVAITTGNSGGASGDAFDAIAGTVAKFSATQARDTLSMEITDTAASTAVQWIDLGDLTTSVYFRAYLWLAANPAGSGARFLTVFTGAAAQSGSLRVHTTGVLQSLNAATGVVGTGAVAVPLSDWFRVEARFISSTTVGQIEWKWWSDPESDGAPDDTLNTTGLVLGANTDLVRLGLQSTNPNTPFTIYLDNVAVFLTDWIGPVEAEVVPLLASDNPPFGFSGRGAGW